MGGDECTFFMGGWGVGWVDVYFGWLGVGGHFSWVGGVGGDGWGRVGMFTGFSITYNLSFLLDIEFTVDAMVPCRHMV